MQNRLIASSLIAMAATAAAAPAWGQQARADAAATPPTAGTTSANGRSAGLMTPSTGDPQPDTQALMAEEGGSLLQATTPPPEDKAGGTPGSGRTPSYNLYAVPDAEPHVLKKHDLVNIVVREQSTSATGGQSNQQRAVDFDAKVDSFIKFKLAAASIYGLAGNNLPEVKLEGKRDFQGTGEYDRTDSMTTRLEAEVIDVKPNGTLVIQARRHMQVDEETIHVTLTGVCRVQDVDATNSVLSTDMHDLDLRKTTTGQVRDTTKRGLLHQLLDILNPF
jgi:flagellar L-ring protein precursor FlgH